MSIKRFSPLGGAARRARLIAVAAGLLAASALAAPTAVADSPGSARATTTQLAKASDAVLGANVAGTAWYTDTKSGKVVVTVDSTVSKTEIAKIKKEAGTNTAAIKINHTPGKFSKLIQGGDAIYGGSYRCSLGFNVRSSSGTYYFLTAGHCGNVAASWYTNSSHTTYIGPTIDSYFPDNDFAIVRYDNSSVSHPGTAGGVDITNAVNAYVGMSVTRTGSTTGTHSGTVTGLNATVNYGGGDVVYGMIQTNVCAESGDSGGPLRSGNSAVGLTSGGSGNCTTGGTTFFQPVTEALNYYGVSVY